MRYLKCEFIKEWNRKIPGTISKILETMAKELELKGIVKISEDKVIAKISEPIKETEKKNKKETIAKTATKQKVTLPNKGAKKLI